MCTETYETYWCSGRPRCKDTSTVKIVDCGKKDCSYKTKGTPDSSEDQGPSKDDCPVHKHLDPHKR